MCLSIKDKDSCEFQRVLKADEKEKSFQNLLSLKLFQIFFPADYPVSVKDNYYTYSKYNFLASISGTAIGVLSTQGNPIVFIF
jgi:hypothetical protein